MQKELNNVSVLVSCYNKEKDYLKFEKNAYELLKAGAEICIIDDGSTDNSRKLLESLALRNSQIVFLSRPNFGSGTTRNELMLLASREVVVYLDMDDELNTEVLVEMCQNLDEHGADVCVANYLNVTEESLGEMPLLGNDIFVTNISECSQGIWESLGFWRYVYRKEFLKNQKIAFFPTFVETRGRYFIFDDIFFLSQLAASAGSIIVHPKSDVLYKYHAPHFDKKAQLRFRRQLQLVPRLACAYIKLIKAQKASSNSLHFVSDYVHFAVSNIYFGNYLQSVLHLLKFLALVDKEIVNQNSKREWLIQTLLNSIKLTKRESRFLDMSSEVCGRKTF